MDVKTYLDNSYTAYHSVKNSRDFLLSKGFVPYERGTALSKGGKYFAEKNGSTIIAFKIGDLSNYAFNIAMAHTDSPSLKVKGSKLIDSPEGKRINVEVYGGLIRYSFMDIPLKIAGRVFVSTKNGLERKLVESPFTVNIPSLCIHHNIEVNDKGSLSVQRDMLPLIGGDESDLYKILCPNDEVVDGDLFVVPAVKSFNTGVNGQFLASPRIDNLTSCFSALEAIESSNSVGVSFCCLFDNEEIGSRTKQGACSDFLTSLLKAVNADLGKTEGDFYNAINNGFVLSIDNGHAIHPAHPEKSDPSEKVFLNGGVVIKHHSNYATDGYSSAVIKTILKNNGVKYQDYYNNSDIRCGGTLGLIVSANLQMNVVDIGLSQLAMHSGIETVGNTDIQTMTDCVRCFYETSLSVDKNNVIIK